MPRAARQAAHPACRAACVSARRSLDHASAHRRARAFRAPV